MSSSCILRFMYVAVIAVLYLTLMYLFDWKGRNRNDPRSIFRRVLGVCLACLLSTALLYALLPASPFFTLLGIKLTGFIPALVFPLVLTMIFFAGPLSMLVFEGQHRFYASADYWRSCFHDPVWWRNQIFAPITEEWAFRACSLPILLHCVSWPVACFVGPLFFSLAHFHHVFEKRNHGQNLHAAVQECCFQVLYTYVFGVYASFIFLRTGYGCIGQLIAAILVHSFCNHMGLPDFPGVLQYSGWRRWFIILAFLGGVAAFIPLMYPLTSPALYSDGI